MGDRRALLDQLAALQRQRLDMMTELPANTPPLVVFATLRAVIEFARQREVPVLLSDANGTVVDLIKALEGIRLVNPRG